MNRLKTAIAGLLILTILGLMGCFGNNENPDVSEINVDLNRIDFDDAFLGIEPGDDIKSELEILKSQYPNLTDIFIKNIMQFQRPRDTSDLYLNNINGFLESDIIQGLKVDIDSVYRDRSSIDRRFEQAFKYLKHYFPEKNTPRLYYLMTEFSYATFIFPETKTRDGLGVSLDMFLGRSYPYKELFPTNAAFSGYLTASFDQAYIVKKGMDAIIDDMVGNPNGQRMIDQMIHNGKKQYLLDKFLPVTADSIKWEFTADQMDWVKGNELNLYSHFTSQKMLYSDDQMKYLKFIHPSPNSPGLPEEAPGRTGNYIGYKIIQSYMDQSGGSLQSMVDEKDTQTILNTSRYKPRI